MVFFFFFSSACEKPTLCFPPLLGSESLLRFCIPGPPLPPCRGALLPEPLVSQKLWSLVLISLGTLWILLQADRRAGWCDLLFSHLAVRGVLWEWLDPWAIKLRKRTIWIRNCPTTPLAPQSSQCFGRFGKKSPWRKAPGAYGLCILWAANTFFYFPCCCWCLPVQWLIIYCSLFSFLSSSMCYAGNLQIACPLRLLTVTGFSYYYEMMSKRKWHW